MTVSSLWKALNAANSGKYIGEQEIVSGNVDIRQSLRSVNPWTLAQKIKDKHPSIKATKRPQKIAIDLSIWICEAITSQGMTEQHSNPVLHLVFTRTTHLLQQGIQVIGVLEGRKRQDDNESFRKRRSGTRFWKACEDCNTMLALLGVPVVRAKAEGEALCALLSQRGIVDAVISNDGDCLLFGAKTVYTKFSKENMSTHQVLRYDFHQLQAQVEKSDNEGAPCEANGVVQEKLPIVTLSRQDLVVFAILTGSDMAGGGLAKVGHKKAIRFIYKCKRDNPLRPETAALDELKSWARAARYASVSAQYCQTTTQVEEQIVKVVEGEDEDEERKCGQEEEKKQKSKSKSKTSTTCCSRCLHQGSKRDHHKYGCAICGTEKGEPCFKVTSDDKFRRHLRAKALTLSPPFDPSRILDAYMKPNDNQIPVQLVGRELQMRAPQLKALLNMKLLVKGHNFATSRTFIQQIVGRLLSRIELINPVKHANTTRPTICMTTMPRDKPVAKQIEKSLIHNGTPSYQISWIVSATLTDENGDGIDEYEYKTVEPRDLVEARFPQLVAVFAEVEVARQKQGDGEQQRRREFLEQIIGVKESSKENSETGGKAKNKPRKPTATMRARNTFFQKPVPSHRMSKVPEGSEDIANLLRFVPVAKDDVNRRSKKSILCCCPEEKDNVIANGGRVISPKKSSESKRLKNANMSLPQALTPSQHIICEMGSHRIPMTPICNNQGSFPSNHIFVHHNK